MEIVARIVGLIVSIGIPVFMVIRAHFMYKRPVPLRQLKSKTWLWGGCYLVLAAIFSFGWSAFGPGDVLAPSQVIMSALVLIVGCLCVHYYGNYFVDIYPDRVVYRKLTRQVHVIEYKDIRYHCIRRNNGDRVLRIRSRSGQMFQMSIVKFNGGALLDYVRWLDSLTEGAEKNFPGAPHEQIERWIQQYQQARAEAEGQMGPSQGDVAAQFYQQPRTQQQPQPQPYQPQAYPQSQQQWQQQPQPRPLAPESGASGQSKGGQRTGDAFGSEGQGSNGPFYRR